MPTNLPPPFTGLPPAPPSPSPKKPPHFGWMFFLGVILFFVSCALCYPAQNPLPFYVIGLGAFISVFFAGYRGIFIGFVTTIGVILLGLVITCGALIFISSHK